MNGDTGISQSVPLARPRPLSARERALVTWFVDGALASPELCAQADAALVVATCSCGCPSVQLEVPRGVPAAPLDGDDPDVRHGEDASFVAHGTSPAGRELDVILHVIAGRLVELEIWAGTFGGDPRTDLPDAGTLSR